MSSAKRIVLAVSVVILTAGWSCTPEAEEAARLLETHADEARSAATKLDGVLAWIHAAPSAERLTLTSARIEEAASAADVPPEIEEAFAALTFDATCAVVFGDAPDNLDELAAWMTNWAVRYGISFLPGGAAAQAGRVLDTVDPGQEWTEAQELCGQVGGVVLEEG